MEVSKPDLLIVSAVEEELRGSFETYVLWMSEMFATLLRFSYFLGVLNKIASLSQNEQVIDICIIPTALTSSF